MRLFDTLTDAISVGGLLAMIFLFATSGRAATTATAHNNSLGVVQYVDNPFTYKEGAVQQAVDIQNGRAMVARLQPTGTYGLFTEDILFCGNPRLKFEGKHNPMVLTYMTVAHRTIEGIGCHELVSVHEVTREEPK